ncbi:sulfurtransferase [Colwellia hornerae]|nr:sulfurtransferase [Colwellia hornerae]
MPSTFQQIISCRQLHELLFSPLDLTGDSVKPFSNILLLDASIPPVGNMCSPEKQWPDFTLPYAKRFDLNKNFSDLSNPLPHTMPSAEHFQQQARALGVMTDSQIVVYDDQGLFSAARAWYMFRAMGHKNVAVLDGGLPAWLASGYSVSSAASFVTDSGNFTATFCKEYFFSSQNIVSNLNAQEHLIVDARAKERFKGKVAEPREGIRSGHIPCSVNLPFSDLSYNGHLLAKNILAERFKAINSPGKPMVMSCGSGVTACVLALTAEMCGYKQVKVYDGSWSEWGAGAYFPVVVTQ